MVKFFSTIFYTLLIGLIVGVSAMLLGSKLAFPGSVEMKIVKSGSMEPAIPTGSVVIVKPSAEYRLDDVITFGKDTKTEVPTTHRIIALNADGTFTVKGDANEEQDMSPVAKRDVIGKVVFHVPYAGFLLDFARQPLGFALLIAVPAALIILEELLTIGRETRKWWKGGGRGGNGTPETLGAHLKMIYVKRRKMDEIFVPRVVERSRLARFLHADAYGTSTALVIGLVFASSLFSGASGGTVAYFQDIERSVGNIFAAASCDAFRIGSCDEELVEIETDELVLETAAFLADSPMGEVAGTSTEICESEDCSKEEEETLPPGGGGGGGGSASAPEEPEPEPEQTPPTEETTPPEPETIPETEQTPESTPEEGEEAPTDAPPTETPPEQEAEPTPEEPASEPSADSGTPAAG